MRPSLKAARNSRTAASVTAPSCNNVAAVSRRSWWPASRQVNDTSAISCPNVRASLPASWSRAPCNSAARCTRSSGAGNPCTAPQARRAAGIIAASNASSAPGRRASLQPGTSRV